MGEYASFRHLNIMSSLFYSFYTLNDKHYSDQTGSLVNMHFDSNRTVKQWLFGQAIDLTQRKRQMVMVQTHTYGRMKSVNLVIKD